jgi:hypothetical protein
MLNNVSFKKFFKKKIKIEMLKMLEFYIIYRNIKKRFV